MSSILDALSKIEAAQRSQEGDVLPLPLPATPHRNPLWLIGGAFVGGAILTAGLLWRQASPPPEPPVVAPTIEPAPSAAAPVVADAAPPVVPAMQPPVLEERPQAHVEPAVPVQAAPPADPTRLPTARFDAPPEPAPTAPSVVATPPTLPLPAPTAPGLPADALPQNARPEPPASLPRVRIALLAYSRAPERRSVSLVINQGALVTLREGEEASGVQVVRILPDRVDLRRAGITFTVQTRD